MLRSDFPRDIFFQGVPFLKLLKTKTLYYKSLLLLLLLLFLIADSFNFSLKLGAIFFKFTKSYGHNFLEFLFHFTGFSQISARNTACICGFYTNTISHRSEVGASHCKP